MSYSQRGRIKRPSLTDEQRYIYHYRRKLRLNSLERKRKQKSALPEYDATQRYTEF
jgi:hypothetical protein